MAFKVVPQKSFIKGIVAVSNRFSLPKGAVMAALNMLMNERGALQTCDGTLLQSAIPGGAGPIITLGAYVNKSFVSTKLAIALSPADGPNLFRLYNWNTNPATDIIGSPGVITPGWTAPQIFMFAGFGVISLGNMQTLQLFNGSTLTAITTTPHWVANTLYQVGDRIQAAGNTFTVSALTLVNSSSEDTSPISGFGFSGNSMPNFAGATAIGDRVGDNQIFWTLTANSVSFGAQTTPAGCAHAINHAGAIWLWNTWPENGGSFFFGPSVLDGPNVIRQSTLNNPNSWPNVNMAYVGSDDGTQGTGIGTFTIAESGIAPTGSLVLFKDFTTYQVTGVFGAQNFAITQVKTDMGCTAGRTVQFCTGHGIIRLCHLGFANFDGVNDTLISEEIRPYIFGRADITGIDFPNAINSRGTLVSNPPMYVCGVPLIGQNGIITRIFCYDLVMKGWMVVDVDGTFGLSAINQLRIEGEQPTTYFGDGALAGVATNFGIRRWQAGDPDFDGTPIPWAVSLPEIGDPGSRAYYRRGQARLHAQTAGKITAQVSVGSITQPSVARNEELAGPSSAGVYAPNESTTRNFEGDEDLAVAFDIGETGASAQANLSGTGKITFEGWDFHIQIKPPRPFGEAA